MSKTGDEVDGGSVASSSEDFYADGSPREQGQHSAENNAVSGQDDGSDASSLDMDLSDSSRASSPDSTVPAAAPAPTVEKRKAVDTSDDQGDLTQAEENSIKKRKIDTTPPPMVSASFLLPRQLWQRVFLSLSPAMLSRCIGVCREFRDSLTDTKAETGAKKNQRHHVPAIALESDAIWSLSRRTYFPSMPRPFPGFREWEMMRLVHDRTCQFCGRQPSPVSGTTAFNSGPGLEGVRIIWPFIIRSCGHCLEKRTKKDLEVIISPARDLRGGLSYVFLTADTHLVPESQFQHPNSIPHGYHLRKVYFDEDIETIIKDFQKVHLLGPGAEEGWREGLPQQSRDIMAEASRWEKWESQMRSGKELAHVLMESDPSSFPTYFQMQQRRSAGLTGNQPIQGAYGLNIPTLPAPVIAQSNGSGGPSSLPVNPPLLASRHPRTKSEAQADQVARKAEIERRCAEFEPPLLPEVLGYIEAYKAAVIIPRVLTEPEWNQLKPRILREREGAELKEHEHRQQLAYLRATMSSTSVPAWNRPANQMYDKEYDTEQEPLRKRLGEYADEFANGHWKGGALNRNNVPLYAVKIMMFVRQKYLQDKAGGHLPASTTSNAGVRKMRDGSPVPDPFLSLDNMKWVVDHKVRPVTDVHRKELLICAKCPEERKPKWFAYEGLVQHYGAKHAAFGRANATVHWQTAEWPDDPPFHTNPRHWTREERKVSDHKGQGRAKNHSHNGREAPFNPPGNGKLLSENPYFSTHSHQASAPFNGYHGTISTPLGHYQGSPEAVYQVSSSALADRPKYEASQDEELEKLDAVISNIHKIWHALDGIESILISVRVQTVFRLVDSDFQKRFGQMPRMDLINNALASDVRLSDMKNANGLACKVCVAAQPSKYADSQFYSVRTRTAKLWNLSSLMSHFKLMHARESGHWMENMIELPEDQLIHDAVRDPGMDDTQLSLVAAAFPAVFPNPLPRIETLRGRLSKAVESKAAASRLFDKFEKKNKSSTSKKGKRDSNTPTEQSKEDEYDPRRPMVLSTVDSAADPGRYDTYAGRNNSSGTTSANAATPAGYASGPEVRGRRASALSQDELPVDDDDFERSPSVGRVEPRRGESHGASERQSTPDFAALLQIALNAQPQAPLPPNNARPVAASPVAGYSSRWPPQNSMYANAVPTHYHGSPSGIPESGQSSPRYAVPPPTEYARSIDPSSGRYDRPDPPPNHEHDWARGRAEQPSAYHAPLAPAFSPQYRGPAAYSPPANQPQHAQPAPVQYFRLDDRYPGPGAASAPPPVYSYYETQPQHRPLYSSHAPAPAAPTYIDGYGNPVRLVAVEAGPAPVQYAPLPPYDPQPFARAHIPPQQTQPQHPQDQSAAPTEYARYADEGAWGQYRQ